MIVTGTGHGGLVAEWMYFVRSEIIVRDIDHLDEYVPEVLRDISLKFPELGHYTATIYHFGYSNNRDRYVGYAYRSTKNWQSEELQEGLGIKPQVSVNLENNFKLPDKFIEIIKLQRECDLKLPIEEQVGIGGDVHFVHMINGEFHIYRCFRFPTYENDYESMCNNLIRKSKSTGQGGKA